MPITLNHSNIGVQYNTGSNYIIETVKSDLYLRDTRTDITSNLLAEPTVISPAFTETIRTFTHSGGTEAQTPHTITLGQNTICDILIVGGGGAGDRQIGGGGGGGAVLYATNITIPANTYTIKVGKGGENGNGGNSEAFGAICLGGGSTPYVAWGTPNNGTAGGSGSGASPGGTPDSTGGGVGVSTKGTLLSSGTLYNGNIGGNALKQTTATAGAVCGGGGGGAGTAGFHSSNSQYTTRSSWIAAGSPSKGGDGVAINITGTTYYWGAGGGGGSVITHPGDGGLGGGGGGGHGTSSGLVYPAGLAGTGGINSGGNGLNTGTENGGNGGAGTGSGGGGGGYNNNSATYNGGNGGSGIVIIKFKTIVNSAIPEGNPITHKTLNFTNTPSTIIYDFTNYNTEATWKAYAATIPNFTYSFNYWFAEGYDGLWYSGIVGFIQYNLPSSYNNLTVYFGNLNAVNSYVRLLINGVEKSRVTNIGTTTYSQQYIQGDILRVEEEGGIINANIIITLTNTNFITNTYTLNFPVPTIADINNNSNIVLQGAYDIALSTSNALIIPKSNQYIPKPTTFASDLLSIRYNLLNPVLDPSGAQWVYNTSNINVYTLGNVGIGTTNPQYTLDVSGSVNAKSYYLNGRQINEPLSELGLSEGMIAQVRHLTYTQMDVKNNTGWDAINDNLTTGFVIAITPKSNLSKILVNIIVHIGLAPSNNSVWWGIKLYRKIGTGDWTEVTGPNGTETGSAAELAGTPVWISYTMYGGDLDYQYKVANVTGTYLDSPNTTSTVYYTAYWNNRLGDNPSAINTIYLNRAESHGDAYRPAPSSSWTASEIWYG